jgi:hypothetical protein
MQIGYPLAGFVEIGLSIADAWVGKKPTFEIYSSCTRVPFSPFFYFHLCEKLHKNNNLFAAFKWTVQRDLFG